MFGVGIPEIIVIMIIALIVIGPDKLPEIARTIGKTLSEFKKVVDGVKSSIEEEQEGIEKSIDMPGHALSLENRHNTLKEDYDEVLEERKDKKTARKGDMKKSEKNEA